MRLHIPTVFFYRLLDVRWLPAQNTRRARVFTLRCGMSSAVSSHGGRGVVLVVCGNGEPDVVAINLVRVLRTSVGHEGVR